MSWSKAVDAGGIGSMRRGMPNWRSYRWKRGRLRKGCGLAFLLYHWGSGGSGKGGGDQLGETFSYLILQLLYLHVFSDSNVLPPLGVVIFNLSKRRLVPVSS